MPAIYFATQIVKKLINAGHIAYFAGGWVRDHLMQHPSDDIDIATSASVQQIQDLFEKTIPVGAAFGIVIVVEEEHQFEVATFRKETGYLDGRRPTKIEPATPQEDAMRRDFTINGMFWDPLKKELFDYVGGQADLKQGIIRAIGDPHLRFLEDRLRMIRAVRYSTRFQFPIEEETIQAIISHAASLFPAVAMERVWQEFKKMSLFARFDVGLLKLHELQLLPTIFPALKGVSLKTLQTHLAPLASFPKNAPTIAELLTLFPSHSLEELFDLCDYLKLSRAEKEIVRFLYQTQQMLKMPPEWLSKLEKVEWAHFYAHPLSQVCLEICAAYRKADQRSSFLKEHIERRKDLEPAIVRIQSQTPLVRSEHLIKAGISPGKQMGILLKEAERISINSGIEEPAEIIHLLKNSPLWNT